MKSQAVKITITENQQKILEKISKSTHGELHFKIRAGIVLKAALGIDNSTISKELELNRNTVKLWRKRWAYNEKALKEFELNTPTKLAEKIKGILSDEYRQGAPATFTAEQVARILDLSLQSPEIYGVEGTNWTQKSLAKAAADLGIVESVSATQIWRFLKTRQI